MAAPKGNKFWEARSSHGRKPIWDDPDDLWDACTQYFQWVEDNPLWEMKAFSYQGVVTQESVPKMRAMTQAGLCVYLGINPDTWSEYGKKNDFSGVVSRVNEIIKEQKFAGAAAELLNPNIIARDLGLSDKKEVEHSGSIQELSDEDLDSKIQALLDANGESD